MFQNVFWEIANFYFYGKFLNTNNSKKYVVFRGFDSIRYITSA